MWFTCIRPMRKGHCAPATTATTGADRDTSAQLAQLRNELAELRAADGTAGHHTPVG